MLTLLGLSLNFVGAVMLAVWGLPQPTLEPGVALGLEDGTPLEDGRTVREHGESVTRRRRRYFNLSRIGLLILAAGFAFQVAGTIYE